MSIATVWILLPAMYVWLVGWSQAVFVAERKSRSKSSLTSAKSGLPLLSRNKKSPKLSITNASPCSLLFAKSRGAAELYTCLEGLSIYSRDVWNAFSSSVWPEPVWSRHQIFQLFGQRTRAWDRVLGKIFFFFFFFLNFILTQPAEVSWVSQE